MHADCKARLSGWAQRTPRRWPICHTAMPHTDRQSDAKSLTFFQPASDMLMSWPALHAEGTGRRAPSTCGCSGVSHPVPAAQLLTVCDECGQGVGGRAPAGPGAQLIRIRTGARRSASRFSRILSPRQVSYSHSGLRGTASLPSRPRWDGSRRRAHRVAAGRAGSRPGDRDRK